MIIKYFALIEYPCTDLTITTEKLMDLFATLNPEVVDELGDNKHLDLPQSETARIQKDYQSPAQRKEAYLDLYIHQHPCPTWSQIAVILRNCANLCQQAALVENTYVKGIILCTPFNYQHCMSYNYIV